MSNASQVYDAIRARLAANTTLPLRFQNEDPPTLEDRPATFVYVTLDIDRGRMVGFGGGATKNLYRSQCALTLYVFVPRGEGFKSAMDKAETLALIFRSYRDPTDLFMATAASPIPGGSGSVIAPPGVDSEVDNYFWAAVDIDLHFDQVG